MHWQSDALTTRLDLIRTRLDLICTRLDLIRAKLDLIRTRLDLIRSVEQAPIPSRLGINNSVIVMPGDNIGDEGVQGNNIGDKGNARGGNICVRLHIALTVEDRWGGGGGGLGTVAAVCGNEFGLADTMHISQIL